MVKRVDSLNVAADGEITPLPPPAPSTKDLQSSLTSTRSMKISERLTKAIDGASLTKNRSPELIPLTAEYERVKKKLRFLIASAKTYQETTQAVRRARQDFVRQMAVMSEGSPLFDHVGSELDREAVESLQKLEQEPAIGGASVVKVVDEYHQRSEVECLSLLGLLHTCGSTQAYLNNAEYQSLIVDYIVDWEKLVTQKTEHMIKELRKLEADRRHYERKVENLRQRNNDLESKGKSSPQSQVEKLRRNEQKLQEAYTIHEREAGKLCALLEAVTHEGYKELYTLVKNYMKWELNVVSRDGDVATSVAATLNAMTTKCGGGGGRDSGKKRSSSKGKT